MIRDESKSAGRNLRRLTTVILAYSHDNAGFAEFRTCCSNRLEEGFGSGTAPEHPQLLDQP